MRIFVALVGACLIRVGFGESDLFGPISGSGSGSSGSGTSRATVLANDERCKNGTNSAIAVPNGTVDFYAACVGACEADRGKCAFVSVNVRAGLCVIANDALLGCTRIGYINHDDGSDDVVAAVDDAITTMWWFWFVSSLLLCAVIGFSIFACVKGWCSCCGNTNRRSPMNPNSLI